MVASCSSLRTVSDHPASAQDLAHFVSCPRQLGGVDSAYYAHCAVDSNQHGAVGNSISLLAVFGLHVRLSSHLRPFEALFV
jgi:hypothetical protein